MPLSFEDYASEGAVVLGGAAAILLQVADPVVGSAVAAHSGFARDPMRRLRRTLGYAYAIALGDDETQRIAAGHVDRSHAGIPGATDPARQLWVAATLYQVGTEVWRKVMGPLDDDLADEIYARSALLGSMLQLPDDAWPADRAAFAVYWADAVAALSVTDDARAVGHDLLHPRRVPLWVRAAMPFARSITPAFLPPGLARAYGLREGGGAAAVRLARVVVRIVPRRIRSIPSRRLLESLRGHG